MADPKKPKQLSEASPLDEFTATGNIYVDPAYTSEDATPAVSPITGEALVFGENTLSTFSANNNNSPAINPEDGHAIFVSNIKRGTARNDGNHFFFGFNRGATLNDVYVVDSTGGDFSVSPRVASNYVADSDGVLNVYIAGTTFGGNLMGFGSQTNNTQSFTGDYEFTIKNSQVQWFCITYGTGNGLDDTNAGNERYGTVNGNIDLYVDGLTVTGTGAILRGAIHSNGESDKAYIRAYIKDSNFQAFGVIQNGVEGGSDQYKSEVDVDITVENTTFAGTFLMFPNVSTNTQVRDGKLTITGDVNFKATNTRFAGLNMGAGLAGTGWNRTGWIKGNIDFNISGSTNSSRTFIHKGFIGSEDEPNTVTGYLTNSVFGDFTGYDTRENNYIYADTTVKMTGSTIGNFTFYNTINSSGNVTPTADRVFGTQKLELAGVRAGNVAGNGPGATQSDATFSLTIKASDTLTQVGAISNWDTITIDAGASVRADSISLLNDEGKLTIAVGSSVTAGSISDITTLYVSGELVEADTVIISGLGEDGVSDSLVIYVGEDEVEYERGIFPGYYDVVGGNLILHNASSTVLLVNSNYTDGEKTDLGPKGYSTVDAAQAAVTDKTTTTIMVYGMDDEVEENVFTADVVTKDYATSFVGESGETVSLDGYDIIVGDEAADVDSANVSITYTDNINAIKFGNVSGTAKLAIDHAGDDEETALGTLDLTGVNVGDAQISVDASVIENVKLADQVEFLGSVVIKNSTITNVYGGAGANVTNDLTGGNVITNVFAEGNSDKIKLGTSTVETYMAGLSESGELESLTYNDSVSAKNMIIGGNANTIGNISATFNGGEVENLAIGGDGDTIGDINVAFNGGKFEDIIVGENATINGGVLVTFNGGTIANFTSSGEITTSADTSNTFYGLIYGASVTGELDGGDQGTFRQLNIEGHAKVGSVKNFDALIVTGGTLNVASGDRKSEVSEANSLAIDGDILNYRTINAGVVSAQNLVNYGAVGTLRSLDNPDLVALSLSGNLDNEGVIATASAEIAGDFVNNRKITALGDITVDGAFTNNGDIYFYATSSREGVFTQEGGLVLNNVDLVNTGFISAGKLTGVKNLTTSKLYVTGGAEIDGNITIEAGAEVAFTNKANPDAANGLTLSGSIYMGDTSRLVVSGDLTTSGTKTITVDVGDLIGAQEIVRAEGGVDSWTVKLTGANSGMYSYVKDEFSVTVYSLDELYVNASFSEDGKIVVDGHTLAFGKNAFASVADAVAAAKSGAKIVIINDATGMDVSASAYDVEIVNSTVGAVSAKNILVSSDSTIASIAAATKLTVEADALLTITDTIAANLPIVIDATAGSGSRLILDVDPAKVTLSADQVTILGKDTYSALVLAGEGEGAPVHAGDLYLISQDNAYYAPSLFTTVEEVLQPNFVDGDTFDAATGDALFAGVNTFSDRAEAVTTATNNDGIFVIFDNVVGNKVGEDGVSSLIEVDAARGDDGQTRALVGVHDDGNTPYVSDQDHTTMIVGSTSRGSVYGLSRWYEMDGDFTFIAKDSVSTGSSMYITGNNYNSVMNGDINAAIIGCTFGTTYIGYGNFGSTNFDPIDVNVTISDSRTGQFRGINISGTTPTTINANINISVYDSMIGGAFYGIGTADWVATASNIYQASFVSGSVNVEVGGTTVSNQFRPGDSIPHGANALQTFNVPTTLHVVATDKSAVTRADWVMEWDTIIIDADATLQVNNGLEYVNAYKSATDAIDNGGQLIQIYVNMSGYAGGTRTVITTGFINTDENMSNISVIGDNDMTGQRQLVYGTNTSQGSGLYHLDRVAIFDKADDMYVNADYTQAITGTTVRGGQELYFGANAHADFAQALTYATEWGGTIVVTGGEFDAEDFDGNNVELQSGKIDEITMGARKASTLKVSAAGTFESADGSGVSTLEIGDKAVVGDVESFASVSVAKGAAVTLGAISGSNIDLFADSLITADSLVFSDKVITIDVTGYLGKAHTVISTENGIIGNAENIRLVGTDAEKYGIVLTDDSLVLTTTIKSDTFLNADYTEATTGTILADGTYLQYGFNAFSNAADAVANLGSTKNTVTVTGGTLAGDIMLNGANFVMEGGELGGYIYGATDDDFSGMSIAIDAGKVGGISLVSADGLYSVSKAAITFADGITVDGVVVGAGDTTITMAGNATVGGIEDVKQITLTTSSLLSAGYIDLNGGTVYVTGGAVENKEGNLHKVISTDAGISGASYACDPGLTIYASAKDVYLMDLTRIYFNPNYTEAVTGTTASNGDTLQWGSNAFANLTDAMNHVVSGGTLYVSGYNGDVIYNSTADAISLNIDGGQIATFRVIGADRNASRINHPVSIDIDGATLTAGIDYILGRSNSYDNVNNSLVYYAPITINLSNGRNNENLRFVGQWDTIQSGITMTLTNWTIAGDFKPFFGDARAADGEGYHSFIDVTFDNVDAPADKWISLANVTDWGQLDYINLTIKNSTIRTGTGGNNMRIGAFDDGNEGRHNHNTPITFTVENSHVNAMLAASNIGGDSSSHAQRTTNYQGTSTLNILGSSNYIKWANWFQAVNMSVDTYLAGGTITFRPGTYQIDEEETINTNGIINIDATGYTGASKILINLESGFRNVEPGSDSFLLNLTQDSDKYALVAGNKALVIWDGNVTNLFYNPAFTSNAVVVGQTGPNGEILVKTVYDEDEEEIKILGNAYGEEEDYDELVGFEDAKKALAAGNTLYITGGTFMSDYEDEPLIYGTIADEDETAFVNLSVLGGLFSGISIAEDGKTVTGDATLELAGGTFGIPAVYETPEATEDDPNPEPELVEDEIPATISGSQDSVGGTSTLLVSGNLTITGDVVEFDVVQVNANLTVSGDFDADVITIDASKKLTVGGDVITESIVIDAENYNGPTKAIAVAGNFENEQPAVTILGDLETYDYRYVEDTLYLVSKNAGNVYLNAAWDESISGTVYNGELLVFGVNAFNAMDEAILKTTSDYTMYILGGVFNEVYDLTGIGQVNLNITGGTIGGFIIGDGADGDHRSVVRINDGTASSAVSIGSLTGVEGSTIGYRVIANKDAAFGTIDGIRYFRFGAGANVSVNGISYILIAGATEGLMSAGEFVVDFAGYTAGAGVLLQTANGIENLFVPTEFLADGTPVSRVVIGANNNADMLMPYYDADKKAVIAAELGEFAFLDANASAEQNGTVISIDGKTATQVYGRNLSNWNVNAGRYAISGGTLFADGGETGAFYWFFTAAPISVNVTGITTGGFVAGYNDDSAANEKYREGDFTAVITATTFTWFAAIAGQGNADAHQEMVVAKYNEEEEDYEDVAWNITISNSVHSMNDFRIARYANLSGGTVNVTISDYDLRGDLMLFDRVFNGHAEGHEGDELEEVNVTLTNVQAPAAKWIQVWEPQESNSTKINVTVTDSNLVGDTFALGLFGVDTTGAWSGEADVYISGVTMATGNLNGGRGQTGGGLDNISGTRRLHVTGGTNRIANVREFNSVEIADGALLTGTQILMSEGEGFILRGEAGYTGDAKVFAVVGTTISGVEQDAAQFVDEDDYEIDGYKAVVGNTSVFIYKTAGDVYYNNTYTADITGTEITEADGTKNFLVYGDNAVSAMKTAYASVDEREGKATIQVMNAAGTLYTFGYKTVVNGGVITNVVGGTNYTTTKVESGEVDPETGEPIMVDVVTPAEDVDSVDITIKSGATVTNVRVASEYSQVSGNALITIADGVALKGTIDGGSDFVGGSSSLVFEGNASAKAITGFDSVTLTADGLVTLTDAFSADAIVIDATGFADFTKKVLVAEGGFGDVAGITVNVIGGDFGYEFLDDGKTLLVTSNLVGNVFANTAWTEEDVHDKFVGDMALVWDKNAFNSFAAAAAAIGEGSTLYLEGGASTDAITLTKSNDVVVSANTVGTALGSIAADGGAITIAADFSADALTGFSAIDFNAGLNVSVGTLEIAEGGKLTIDVTGYVQEDFDAVVLSVENTNLTHDDIVLVGEGAGVLYAYVDELDNDVHLMRIDNFYVDVDFGTAGENIEPGQVNPITGEKLLFGVNAFYYLNDALGKMAPGQSLYINNRQGNNVDTHDRIANIYLTNSTVPVLINGYTTGDQSYVGDVWMKIENSTFATAAGSFLFGDVTVGEAWNHNQHIFGNMTIDVTGSTMGGDTGAILVTGFSFVNVYGTEENPALITFNFTDSIIRDDILFIGDSPIGLTAVIDGQTYTGADLLINMENVSTPQDKWWRIQGGDQNSQGTITVNLKNSTFGDNGGMRFSLDDNWGTGWGSTPHSASDFIFNLEDVVFKGYLLAGRLDYGRDDSELTTYTGAKTLNISGDVAINNTYWFKELNLTSDATFTGGTLRMATTGAKINIDVTGYTGPSKVFITMDNAFQNVTVADINLIGLEEGSPYTIVTDYDPEAEAPAITAVVLKGAIKDIYVNSDYTAEDFKLGTSYNGEALFFGENAFSTVEDAIAALTAEDAGLFVTGGKVKTAVLPTNSLTIDATAQLTYNGTDVITIDGTLNNEGTLVISAAGFIGNDASDILVLTATAITGEGTFKTDNSAYMLNLVGNELHLVAKKLDVFVNTAWSDLEAGSVVEIPGGTAIVGDDAFATADAAAATVADNGTITILASDVSFTNAIVRTVVATDGSIVNNANVGTGTAVGTLTLQSGAVATAASVRGKGVLTVEAGATVTGGLGMLSGAQVTFAAGSVLDFDISAAEAGASASVTNFSILTGTPDYTITLAAAQALGTYSLATDAASFNSSATLMVGDVALGAVALGSSFSKGGFVYTLGLTDNNELALTIEEGELPDVPSLVYVNSEWTGLEDGSIVTVGQLSATIGYDAFAALVPAIAGVTEDGAIEVVGGEITFAEGYSKTITVDAGATVIGKATFDAAITINGTIAFNTADATDAAAQFNGFSFVSGAATYTLTDKAPAAGTYLLASDVASFTSDVVFGDVTLKVGEEAVQVGDFTYALGITDNNELALFVAEYVPPTPTTPTHAFVSSEWADLEDGTIVTIGDVSAKIGYDAFATLEAGIAGVTADGSVEVVGGEVSFADGYYKTITVDADTTVVGTASFLNKPITINGTMAFDVALTTRTTAQFADIQFVSGDTKYTLTVDNPTVGVYMLASGLWYDDLYQPVFNGSVTFGDAVLTVGNDVTIGDFTYGLRTTSNLELMLVVDKAVAPTTDVTFLTAGLDGYQNMIGRMIPSETAGFTSDIKFYTLDSAPWGMTLGIEDGWTYAGVGDFNGDGMDDILRYNNSNGLVVADNSNGNGTFTPAVLNAKNASWDIIGTGDFNGDGFDDVLVANRTAASSSIGLLGYWANGTTWTLINGYSDEWTLVDTGDYDGNGCTDMLWKNSFVGDGGLTYSAYCTWRLGDIEGLDWSITMVAKVNETETPDTDAWSYLATGDFNGDGIDDIAMVNDVGMVAINSMAADGTSLAWTTLDMIADGWSVAGVADLNLDGIDDMILCTEVEGVGSLAGYWQITADEQTGHPTNTWKDVGWLV